MNRKNKKPVISADEAKAFLESAVSSYGESWAFGGQLKRLTPEQLVEIAKGQFPRLELKLATRKELERTKRLLIGVAGLCLLGGGALCVFSPQGKEQVAYVIAAILAILPMGAIGVQEFRLRTIGSEIEAGRRTVHAAISK